MELELDYTVETEKSVEAATSAVEEKAKAAGFGVLHIHDVKATLESKGFKGEPLRIIEICNPGYASRVLKKDIKVSLMLPCPISVYEQGGKTFISTFRAKVMKRFYSDPEIGEVADKVEESVIRIVDEAK